MRGISARDSLAKHDVYITYLISSPKKKVQEISDTVYYVPSIVLRTKNIFSFAQCNLYQGIYSYSYGPVGRMGVRWVHTHPPGAKKVLLMGSYFKKTTLKNDEK